MTTVLKNSMGNHYRKSLFYEMRGPGEATYTLKDRDHQVEVTLPSGEVKSKLYLSLYRLYMELGDLTEYQFANKYLDGWSQWCKLLEANWFKPFISRWRTELELKFKAEALQRVIEEARDGGKNTFSANKFLIEKGWIDKAAEETRRGRPSKADIARAAAEQAFSHHQVDEDYKRLELKEIN